MNGSTYMRILFVIVKSEIKSGIDYRQGDLYMIKKSAFNQILFFIGLTLSVFTNS